LITHENFDGNERMNFAKEQADPRRHLLGISTVLLLHVVGIYALTNGMGRKLVDVIKKPLDVSIIEEVQQLPPPPQPKVEVPPPKMVEPPPAYVPPPEVQVAPPPVPPPVVIAAVTPEPPAVVVPVVPAAPKVASVGVVCPNHSEVRSRVKYPAQAERTGLTGRVLVEFIVSPNGAIGNVNVANSTNPIFNSAATSAVAKLNCVGQDQNVRIQVPFVFELGR
jgi:protein TonB